MWSLVTSFLGLGSGLQLRWCRVGLPQTQLSSWTQTCSSACRNFRDCLLWSTSKKTTTTAAATTTTDGPREPESPPGGVHPTHDSGLCGAWSRAQAPVSFCLFSSSWGRVSRDPPLPARWGWSLFVQHGDTLHDPVPTCCSHYLTLIPKSMFQPKWAAYHSFNVPIAFLPPCLFKRSALCTESFYHSSSPAILSMKSALTLSSLKRKGLSGLWMLLGCCVSAPASVCLPSCFSLCSPALPFHSKPLWSKGGLALAHPCIPHHPAEWTNLAWGP